MSAAVEKFKEMSAYAHEIKNDGHHDLRDRMTPGDGWAQGDVMISMLGELPAGAEKVAVELQLAPGTTRGSRHCLDSESGITMYRIKGANVLQGPVFTVENSVTVTHPEHGHVTLGAGTYGITYQRQFAETLKRVED